MCGFPDVVEKPPHQISASACLIKIKRVSYNGEGLIRIE